MDSKSLSQVDVITSLTDDQHLIAVAGGAVKRITKENLEKSLTPPVTAGATTSYFTLEQTSSPEFTVHNRGAAELYQAQMGGFMFFKSGTKWYAAKLNGAGWSTFSDGTPVTSSIIGATECMVKVPDCYFKGNEKTLYFGGLTPIDGGNKFDSPHWVGAYKMGYPAGGSNGTNDWHSRPGYKPSHSKTMDAFRSLVQTNLGEDWGLANYGFHCLINALFQARYGNLNSQAIIGAGFQNSNWEAARDVPMGQTILLGDASGKVLYNDATLGDQYSVKLFGFEDLWGKLWEFRPGIRFVYADGVRTAHICNGNKLGQTDAADRTVTCTASGTTGGYIKNMVLGDNWDMIPILTGAGDTSFYCDGFWYTQDATDRLLIVGGVANNGARCGLAFSSSDDAFSRSSAYIGARPTFYGEPEIVSGADLADMIAA